MFKLMGKLQTEGAPETAAAFFHLFGKVLNPVAVTLPGPRKRSPILYGRARLGPAAVVTARIDRFIAEGGTGPYPDME